MREKEFDDGEWTISNTKRLEGSARKVLGSCKNNLGEHESEGMYAEATRLNFSVGKGSISGVKAYISPSKLNKENSSCQTPIKRPPNGKSPTRKLHDDLACLKTQVCSLRKDLSERDEIIAKLENTIQGRHKLYEIEIQKLKTENQTLKMNLMQIQLIFKQFKVYQATELR